MMSKFRTFEPAATDDLSSTSSWHHGAHMPVRFTSSDLPTLTSVNTTSASKNNWRSAQFGQIYLALYEMARLPQDHAFKIQTDVAERCRDLLAIIEGSWSLPAPRIFSNDDGLTFKWKEGSIEKFLTLTSEEIDLLERNTRNAYRCHHELGSDGRLDAVKLFEAFGQTTATTGTRELDVTQY